jgi:uncharacterized lipoprotein YmbA
MRHLCVLRMCHALAAGLLLTACGTSQPTRYYLLTSSEPESAPAASTQPLTIGLGPVSLPGYLDRPEIVSRSAANELTVAVYNEWGEPLTANVTRVLSDNLAHRLNTDRIVLLPLRRSLRSALGLAYQVAIDFSQFERIADGTVRLKARWVILDADKNELVLRRAEYVQPTSAEGYAAQAAAQSQALERLGEEIAAAILDLERSRDR